jgi:hypothetical protein
VGFDSYFAGIQINRTPVATSWLKYRDICAILT